MWALISPLGLKPIVSLNVFWILTEELGIDVKKVVFIATPKSTSSLSWLPQIFNKVRAVKVESYNVEENFNDMVNTARVVLDKLLSEGFKVIVDVTSGRKIMCIALFNEAIDKADAITYLMLAEHAYDGVFYPYIPKGLTKLVVLRGNLSEGGSCT